MALTTLLRCSANAAKTKQELKTPLRTGLASLAGTPEGRRLLKPFADDCDRNRAEPAEELWCAAADALATKP